jgi:leader peptidase (prepilin peptidase)/N-methyltransferase
MKTWFPVLALVLGMASGEALAAYAGWIVRCRRGGFMNEPLMQGSTPASLVNGLGWLLAWLISPTAAEAAELGLMVSAAVVLTLIDVRIRVIPNELAAALLCLSVALSWLDNGLAAFPGRLAGFLTALALFLLAMLIAGPGKVGGGDVKLAAAVGFAAGFPDVLMAVLVMALAACLTGVVGAALKKMGRKTPMPFAGFITAGLALTMFLDRAGALGFMK